MPILYFIRHGVTDFNIAHRLQGRTDTALTSLGVEQGRQCGRVLHDLFAREQRPPADYGYVSSPMRRAQQTMRAVRDALRLPQDGYLLDDRLMEISYGSWEGLTLPEITARDPDLLAQRETDKWDFEPPGGESYRAVARRVAEWYATLKRDTVVVAHGGIARVLMANFHVLGEEEAVHAAIEHGTVYVFADGTLARYT
jgi:broad specificity phosphatase PhoE